MKNYFEIYPEYNKNNTNIMYFIEFSQWKENDPITYQIFQRNLNPDLAFSLNPLGEVHPYQLLEGTLVDENFVCFNTKKFLKFFIDAANEKINNDKNKL